MLMAASQALAAHSPQATLERGGLLPAVEDIGEISRAIALATARAAQQDGVARRPATTNCMRQ
jgi:malate dehydrogenase (oxaloacetate-decarboxylating)